MMNHGKLLACSKGFEVLANNICTFRSENIFNRIFNFFIIQFPAMVKLHQE